MMRHLALLVMLITFWGCQRQPITRDGATSAIRSEPRVVVVGIDETGSYALGSLALRQAAEVFKQNAQPGDLWVFRRITRDSYSDRATISVYQGKPFVEMPEVRPKPSNAFNKQAMLEHLHDLKRFATIRQQVAESLVKVRLGAVRGTDIWGFLRKAADLGATDLIMFTDLGDTRNLRVQLNLNGARVWVLAFQGGRDPRRADATRRRWTTHLRKAGASQVTFGDISQPLPSLR